MTKTIVDIHIIQTVPPSCVNRDDTGRPKTAQYGGVQRARVSSQAWKKAVRDYFRDKLGNEQVGIRTLNYAALIAKEIVGQSEVDFEQAEQLAQEVLSNAGITKGGALFFISRPQISALAKLAIDHPEDEKDYKKLAKEYIKKN
ncbi:MAG: type I-E CRISPR-associated protein Cas7/Cse4/CasC, partial [Bifidobacteriaceae bacterium]|nr:type I-E CRISPR-associated protein Cas7/Cse4/CasC [Bifidobacteriaceae bacterium]